MYAVQKFVWITILTVLVGVIAWLLTAGGGSAAQMPQNDGKMAVFVSIPPLKYVVERIGGDRVTVTALVRPGANPHTFEPLPDQMAGLSQAKLFFLTGDPSEIAWLEKVRGSYPGVTFVRTDTDIAKRPADGQQTEHREHDCAHHAEGFAAEDHAACPNYADHHGGGDPHIWLSPHLLKEQARAVAAAVAAADPAHTTRYQNNLLAFADEMDALDGRIATLLASFKGRPFIVFHPSWGYFADAYGLKQVPIEIAGKESGAQHLAAVTDIVRREKVSALFVAPQFSGREAQAVADATGAKVVMIDPLVEDVAKNLWSVAEALAASFGGAQ